MRADAASLLARLGRRDFRYREFSDTFADMELWPIFEAVLTDERVVGKTLTKLEAREAEASQIRRAVPAHPIVSDDSETGGGAGGGLFDAYAPPEAVPNAPAKGNLRDFLGHLSQSAPKRDI